MVELRRAVDVTISGRVQGVGFRYSTQLVARRLGVSGVVRNRPDGSVSVIAQGPADAVSELIRYLEVGPSLARVTALEVTEAEPHPNLNGFTIDF